MSPRFPVLMWTCLLVGGCVTQDVQLAHGDVKPLRAERAIAAAECRLPAVEVVDVRSYHGLGWIGGHELLYPDLQSWVLGALTAAAATDRSLPPLRVEIHRAYIESHPSSHSFQLVLRVRDAAADAPPRVYRGNDSGITWWGTDAEFGGYVRAAGRKAIAALVRGEARCANR